MSRVTARAVTFPAAEAAVLFLFRLNPVMLPFRMPLSSGGIRFEWAVGDEVIRVDFGADGAVRVRMGDFDSADMEGYYNTDDLLSIVSEGVDGMHRAILAGVIVKS